MNYTDAAATARELATQASQPETPDTYRVSRELAVYHLRTAARALESIAAAKEGRKD